MTGTKYHVQSIKGVGEAFQTNKIQRNKNCYHVKAKCLTDVNNNHNSNDNTKSNA